MPLLNCNGIFLYKNIFIYLFFNYLNFKINFMEEKQPTIGQQRVQRNFNPSANPLIENLKQKYSDLIDTLEEMKADGKNARCLSIAQTELETSCMYAVKSLFA